MFSGRGLHVWGHHNYAYGGCLGRADHQGIVDAKPFPLIFQPGGTGRSKVISLLTDPGQNHQKETLKNKIKHLVCWLAGKELLESVDKVF